MSEKVSGQLQEIGTPEELEPREVREFFDDQRIDRSKKGETIRGLLHKKNRIPHLQEIIEAIIKQWGGPSRFAQAFFETYSNAKAGSLIRARMLEKCIDLMKLNSTMFGASDAVDAMDDDELENFVIQALGRGDGAGEESES